MKQPLSSLAIKAFARMDIKKSEGSKPLSEHHAAQKAEYAKTARLRAMRLAKEAAEREAAKHDDAERPRPKTAKKKKVADAPPKSRRSISWGL